MGKLRGSDLAGSGGSAPVGRNVSASAVGYYGNAHDNILVESSEPGVGFLSDV